MSTVVSCDISLGQNVENNRWYKNLKTAVGDPATWTKGEKLFERNGRDRCIERCRLCKQIAFDVNGR